MPALWASIGAVWSGQMGQTIYRGALTANVPCRCP